MGLQLSSESFGEYGLGELADANARRSGFAYAAFARPYADDHKIILSITGR